MNRVNTLWMMQQTYKENIDDTLNVDEFLRELYIGVGLDIAKTYSLLEDPIFLKVMQKKCDKISKSHSNMDARHQYEKLATLCKRQRKKPVDRATTGEFVQRLLAVHFFND